MFSQEFFHGTPAENLNCFCEINKFNFVYTPTEEFYETLLPRGAEEEPYSLVGTGPRLTMGSNYRDQHDTKEKRDERLPTTPSVLDT